MTEQRNESAYLFSVAFLLLGILFFLLAIYCIPCIIKAFKGKQFFPKVFYIFTLITCIDQATYQLLYLYQVIKAINNNEDDQQTKESMRLIFFQTIYIPDAIFFIIYFSLFWQFLIMMHQGRIQTGNILIGKKNWNPQSANAKVRFLLYLYMIFQGIVIWYFFVRDSPPKIFMIFDIVVNASVPLIVLIMILYMNVKFSGSPFVSNRYEKRNHKIQQLLWIWIILRIPQLVVNVIIVKYNEDIIKLFAGTLDVSLIKELFLTFFIVGDVILVQIVPLLIAMSNEFVRALSTDQNIIQLLGSVETYQEDLVLQSIPNKQQIKSIEIKKFNNLKLSDIKFDEKQIFRKLNGFGEIKIANLKNLQKQYIMRIISFKELSSFLIDETKQELEFINNIQLSFKILWFEIIDSNMYLLSKYYPNQSLHYFIHTEQQKINQYQITKSISNKQLIIKVNIAIDLIQALNNLHQYNIIHGHLNPNNVMFTKKYNIKIVDYGLRAIKKYSGLVNGYFNKSGFTAPECLIEKGNVVSHSATKESDIYSYGMILYNLFAETIPFYNMPIKEIIQLVKEQQNRPKIPDSVHINIATLIRYCWQQEPSQRPDCAKILTQLKQFSKNLE